MKKKLALLVACACVALCACALTACGGSSNSAKYKIVDTLQEEHYAIAFKKGNTELAGIVNDTIAQLDKDGKVKELIAKYEEEYNMSYDLWCFEAPKTKTSSTIDKLEFIVGFDAEYPPYGYMDESGNYVGFDLDLAKLVCEANGWTFKALPIDWDAKEALIESGQITCIWNGFTAEGREDEYALSNNYMENGQVVVVKSDSKITKRSDLEGKIVMTQAGSAAYEMFKGEEADAEMASLCKTFKSLETVPDYANAFMQLDSGACDAIVCDLSVANTYLKKS